MKSLTKSDLRFYKLSATAVLLMFVWLFPVTATWAEDRALLIGVGDYAVGASLPGIKKDVAMMKKAVHLMGFKEFQVKVIMNRDATLAGIREGIKTWLINGVSQKDRVVFYYSGHGSQIRDDSGDEKDKADEVLMPYDVASENKTLVRAFLDDEFGRLLAAIPARETIVFLDACHSGTATKALSLVENEAVPKFFYYKGMPNTKANFAVEETSKNDRYIALSACLDNEEALATKSGSLFTRGIYHALTQSAKGEGTITIDQLRERAAAYILKMRPKNAKPHQPMISGRKEMRGIKLIRVKLEEQPKEQWNRFRQMVGNAAYKVTISTNQSRYRLGDLLVITCRSDRAGYLNIINVTEDDERPVVLFPNKYHPQNYISASAAVTIPATGDAFRLRARPPVGKSMIVVFHTTNRVNAYADGKGNPADLFRTLSTKSLRGFMVEQKENPGSFGAGMIVTEIHE